MSASFLSEKVLALAPSATMAMSAKAKKLAAEGKSVISFSVGEPDFKTPLHICEAAKKAIDDGDHAYTPTPGTMELRKAIAKNLTKDTGATYEAANIVASPGAKYSLYLTMLALLNPGDEVIIPAPYWVSYPEMVSLCGGKPVFVNTKEEDNFAISPDALDAAITNRTKMLVLNSPCNPTGQVTPAAVIKEIGKILEKRGIWCISDEIYNHLVFNGTKVESMAAVSDYCHDHTIVVNGCSKTYAMTGWRLGWIGARKEIAKAVDDLQSQTTSNPNSIAQAAGLAALEGPQDCVEVMRQKFAERRDLVSKLLGDIDGVTCSVPTGAFYALPNISGLFGRTIAGQVINNPTDFCNVALEKAYVALVPGEPFGAPAHMRMSYATSDENIVEGCRRLKALVQDGKI